jgi:hypothetical protein
MRIGSVVAAGLVLLALAAPAAAQQDPFSPRTTPAPTTLAPPPVSQPVSSRTDEGGMSATAKTGLLAAAALFLGLIAAVIVRDARRSSPRRARPRRLEPAGKVSAAPGARGRPTGKASATRRRRRQARR